MLTISFTLQPSVATLPMGPEDQIRAGYTGEMGVESNTYCVDLCEATEGCTSVEADFTTNTCRRRTTAPAMIQAVGVNSWTQMTGPTSPGPCAGGTDFDRFIQGGGSSDLPIIYGSCINTLLTGKY